MNFRSTSPPAAYDATALRQHSGVEPRGIDAVVRGGALITALIIAGVALRIWAYAGNKSLFLDEILVARNIFERPLTALLAGQLWFDQVAPRGFLFAERVAVFVFGRSELALRLFPFLGSIAGIFLFRRLAERTLAPVAVPLAVALFVFAIPLIRYSAEAKPYGIDAAVAILLVLIAMDLCEHDRSTTRLILGGVAGLVIALLSLASVLIMGGLGLALAVRWLLRRDRRTARALFITVPIWAVACLMALILGLRTMPPGTRQLRDNFWSEGFLPLPLDLRRDLEWFWSAGIEFFNDPALLRYPLPLLFLGVAALGIVALWRTKRDVALFLLGPFAVALLAAVVHQYPFSRRLLIYLLPGALLAIAAGAEAIREWAGRVHPKLGGTLAAMLLVPPMMALVKTPPPYPVEHHRALLAYLQQHRQPGDVIYVSRLPNIGTVFYRPRFGFRSSDMVLAICNRDEIRPYLTDIDRFRGTRRFWLLPSWRGRDAAPRIAVERYLTTIGVRRDSLYLPSFVFGRVGLELYDLSDTTRLKAANAETFPVPPMPEGPRPLCYAERRRSKSP